MSLSLGRSNVSVSAPRVTRNRPARCSSTEATASSSERTARHSMLRLLGAEKLATGYPGDGYLDALGRASTSRWLLSRTTQRTPSGDSPTRTSHEPSTFTFLLRSEER